MTENKRIVVNVLATYARSVFALVCGIIAGRWTFLSLGAIDYGLFGLIGGLMIVISFLNGLLSASVGRFYGLAVGEARVRGAEGLEECRRWFNTAVLIHTLVPVLLVAVGYPIGDWAIRHWFAIPADRVEACVWVFRFTCFASFVGMFSAAFRAMYWAKQQIAELTIYSVVGTALNTVFLYYMVTHPGVWLVKFALWICVLTSLPEILVVIRALVVFPECRFRKAYLWDARRFKELFSFAGWQFFGNAGSRLLDQGVAFLVNKYFGPVMNSACAIGRSLSTQTGQLASSLAGSLQPAIVNACGEGKTERMLKLAHLSCKVGTLGVAIFAIPFILEADEVLRIWLKTPPAFAAGFVQIFACSELLSRFVCGYRHAISAKGCIRKVEFVNGFSSVLAFLLGWVLLVLGCSVYAVGWAVVLSMGLASAGTLFLARRQVGISVRAWTRRIFLPFILLFAVAGGVALTPRFLMASSFLRVCATTAAFESVLGLLTWFCLFTDEERDFCRMRLRGFAGKFKR